MTGDPVTIVRDGAAACAKLAGRLYLVIFVVALVAAGDPGAVGPGPVGDLVVVLCDVVLAVTFYVLLRPVNRALALLAAAMRLMHSAITGVNLLANSFDGTAGRDALALLFLESYDYFFATGLGFFGMHLLVLGFLTLRRAALPLLVVASGCYLANGVAVLVAVGHGGAGSALALLPPVVAELSLCAWLVRSRRTSS